jgi:hypothetical protein
MRITLNSQFLLGIVFFAAQAAYGQSALTADQVQQIEAHCRQRFSGEEQNIKTCILNRKASAGDQQAQETLNTRGAAVGAQLLATQKTKEGIATDSVGKTTTQWSVVQNSVTQLLNEGWAIGSFASRDTDWRVVTSATNAMGGVEDTAVWPRTNKLELLLEKAGKYVYCKIEDPTVSTALSVCRALN